MVFTLERFPSLTRGIFPVPNLPTKLPLSLGWIDVFVKYFRSLIKRKNAEQLEEKFKYMTVDDINWMSNGSNRLQVPRNSEDQLLLKYVCGGTMH
jgi:hypothetical protein